MAECKKCIHFKPCEFYCRDQTDKDNMDADVCSMYTEAVDVAPRAEVATSVINDLLDLLHSGIGDIKMSPDSTYQIVYLYAKEIEKKYTEEKKQ